MKHFYLVTLTITLNILALLPLSEQDGEMQRLHNFLFKENKHNKLVRPVEKTSDVLTVYFEMWLSSLAEVNLRYQVMTTSVWCKMTWKDYKLKWRPQDYGNITKIVVSTRDIWIPDVVLYNNAEGNYEIIRLNRAEIEYDGSVVWMPPAVYKSSCLINIADFPYDIQSCTMKVGTWSYDALEVDFQPLSYMNSTLKALQAPFTINFADFGESVEWEVLSAPGKWKQVFYPCCPDVPFPDITYNVTMRRKTLYFTINLILPCVEISSVSIAVFHLPADSGEKAALLLSVLVAMTVFILLLAEIIPPSSICVPLIAKYLLFTMTTITFSILVTIFVLNVHFVPSSSDIPPWIRKIFLEILPKYLRMKRPQKSAPKNISGMQDASAGFCSSTNMMLLRSSEWKYGYPESPMLPKSSEGRLALTSSQPASQRNVDSEISDSDDDDVVVLKFMHALEGFNKLAAQMKKDDKANDIKEDWKYIGMVVDRLFFWVFAVVSIIGTILIMTSATSITDNRPPITAEADAAQISYDL